MRTLWIVFMIALVAEVLAGVLMANSQATTPWPPESRTPFADGTDLGRAMGLCEGKRVPSGRVYTTLPPRDVPAYADGWQSCHKILRRWEESESAKAYRRQQAQEEADRLFVEEVSGR